MSKQHSEQKGIGTNGRVFEGSTSKHTVNTPAPKGAPEGNAAPGKHKRGKQGQ